MTSLFVGFVLVLVVPLILSGWRTSLVGLALQGLLMGWLVLEEGRPPSAPVALMFADLFLLRGLLVPLYLYRLMLARGASSRQDLLPPNLFSWALAGAMLFLSLRFGRILADGDAALATHVFVATAALLLGLLILGTQTTPFSQIVGILRVENAVALYELAAPEPPPLPIQLGLVAVYAFTVAMFIRLLREVPLAEPPPSVAADEVTL